MLGLISGSMGTNWVLLGELSGVGFNNWFDSGGCTDFLFVRVDDLCDLGVFLFCRCRVIFFGLLPADFLSG